MSKVTNEQLEKGIIANLVTGKELNINPHSNEGFTREDHLAAVSFYKGLTDGVSLTPQMLLQMNKNLNIHNSLADQHFANGGNGKRFYKSEVERDFEKGLPTYEDLEEMDNLEKGGGEGSRGGKVIGHTKSGKPIYDSSGHKEHKNFSHQDHTDAAEHHDKLWEEAKSRGDHEKAAEHDDHSMEHQERAYHLEHEDDDDNGSHRYGHGMEEEEEEDSDAHREYH